MNLPTNASSDTGKRVPRRAPGPRGRFLLGSLIEFKQDPIAFLQQCSEDYGDVVRIRFGPIVAHLVNRPEYAEQVLARGGCRYDKKTRSVSKIHAACGDSLLASSGESWRRHRRLIQPSFQPQFLTSHLPTIDHAIDELTKQWRVTADAKGDIDIVSEMTRLTMSIASQILFESDVSEDSRIIQRALSVVLDDTWRRIQSPIDLSVLSPKLHRPAFRAALREIDQVVYRIIAERKQSGVEKHDLLSALLLAADAGGNADGDARLTEQELRDAVITMLLAGFETTASALAWAFVLISQSSQVEEKIRDEAGTLDGDKSTEHSQARMAFMEVLRLYPSVWIIERRVTKNEVIGGFDISRNSMVMISPYLLHRHPDLWKRPEDFDPSRFEPSRIANRPRHAYIPFGLGPHKCIGEPMASLVGIRTVTRVCKEFHLRLVAGQTTEIVPGITLRHRDEVRMAVRHAGARDKAQSQPEAQ